MSSALPVPGPTAGPCVRLLLALGLLGGLGACAPSLSEDAAEIKPGSTDGGDGADGADGGTDGADGGTDGADGGSDGGDGGDGGGGPVDEDNDGFTSEEDCDDSDPEVFPGAEEGDDGKDNDCDGYEDEVVYCDGTFADLQEAVDEAEDGSAVEICPGTYRERVDLTGRELALIGIDGAEATVLAPAGGVVVTVGRGAEARLVGLTLTGGEAESGAGLSCVRASLELDAVIIEGNVATGAGGGVAADDCTLGMTGTAVRGNTAGGYGGGLYLNATEGEIEASEVSGNIGLEGGGLFINGGDVDLLGNEIAQNQTTSVDEEAWGPGAGGGGLWTSASSVVEGNTFRENHSAYSGGGAYFYRGRQTFRDNLVVGNTCGEDGAGAFMNIIQGTISGNTFDGNAANDDGGGLRLYFGSTTIDGNVLRNNTANDDGGGMKVSHSEHTISNNTWEYNTTGDAGGGLELDNDSSHVVGGTFIGNRAGRGGGVHNWRTERRFTIEDVVFEGNVATDCGGGMHFDNNPYVVTVQNALFTGNEAGDGSAICTDKIYRDPEDVGGVEGYFQESLLLVRNTLFVDNVAADDGTLYIKAADVDLTQVVIADNEGGDAGAIALKGGPVTIHNSIIGENTGGATFLGEPDEEVSAVSLTVTYTNLYDQDDVVDGTLTDPSGGTGNISADPRFTSSYELSGSSPCVDAGDPAVDDTDGSRSDMGAFGGPHAG